MTKNNDMILYRQMGNNLDCTFCWNKTCLHDKKMKAGSRVLLVVLFQGVAQDDRKLKYVIPEQTDTDYRRF